MAEQCRGALRKCRAQRDAHTRAFAKMPRTQTRAHVYVCATRVPVYQRTHTHRWPWPAPAASQGHMAVPCRIAGGHREDAARRGRSPCRLEVRFVIFLRVVACHIHLCLLEAVDESMLEDEEEAARLHEAERGPSSAADWGGTTEAERESEEEQEAEQGEVPPDASQGDTGRMRRDGLPCRALVDRSGDLFVAFDTSARTASEALRHVTQLRLRALGPAGDPDDYLSMVQQKWVAKEYQEAWLREPENAAKLDELRQRCKTEDAIKRTIASNYRVACFQRFGGQPWLYWYIAIGDIPSDLVNLVNEHIGQRIREAGREPSSVQQPGPWLSRRSLAASQGADVPPPTGVQHTLSQAKVARKWAKTMDKKVNSNSYTRMPWWQWTKMLNEREVVTYICVGAVCAHSTDTACTDTCCAMCVCVACT